MNNNKYSYADDAQITVTADDEVGAIAIVMVWHKKAKEWVNSGLVVNDKNPVIAFQKALGRAIEEGLWES